MIKLFAPSSFAPRSSARFAPSFAASSVAASLLVAATLMAPAPSAVAQQSGAASYPNRTIRLIVPFSPGGFTDVVSRILSQRLTLSMGQSVVVENKAGAGSTIGADFVAKSAPDGYTLLMVSATHVISPSIYKKLPYDAITSFTPITKLADGAYVMLTHPSVPAANVREFIALAKAQPGKFDYASSGNGSAQHLVGALFASTAGVNIRHVPYRGSAQAAQDLVGGFVHLSFAGVPNALAHVPAGRLRALAVSTKARVPQLPDVPTLDEAGVPGFDATVWLALLAPAGTPPEIVAKIHAAVEKALAAPDARKAILDSGVEVSLSTPDELGRLMRSDLERWGKVVKETGAKVD